MSFNSADHEEELLLGEKPPLWRTATHSLRGCPQRCSPRRGTARSEWAQPAVKVLALLP